MRVMRAWQICPKWSMALGAAAKCGSTMLARLVQANSARRLNVPDARQGRECWSVVPNTYRKVFIVRHPVDRFFSLYSNVQQRPREATNFYKQLEDLNPTRFLDRLLELSPDLTYDFHFQPQALAAGALNLELVRLEAFEEWWQKRGPQGSIPPKKANESDPEEYAEAKIYLAARLADLYRDDLAMWERAWESEHSSID